MAQVGTFQRNLQLQKHFLKARKNYFHSYWSPTIRILNSLAQLHLIHFSFCKVEAFNLILLPNFILFDFDVTVVVNAFLFSQKKTLISFAVKYLLILVQPPQT